MLIWNSDGVSVYLGPFINSRFTEVRVSGAKTQNLVFYLGETKVCLPG